MGTVAAPATSARPQREEPAITPVQTLTGCTVALRSQLAHAVVLRESFRTFNPGSEFLILVLDAFTATEEPGICSLAQSGLTPAEVRQLPMLHDASSLAEVAAQRLVSSLLERHSGAAVIYIDPDSEIFAPLDLLHELLLEYGSLVGAGPGRGFLATTESWTRNGNDRTPFVLEAPGWDVGYWNVLEQPITKDADHYLAGNAPLRLFRFRGYLPEKPHLLSSEMGARPAVLLSEDPILMELCDRYRQQLFDAGRVEPTAQPSALDVLPSGLPIDPHMRRVYREAFERFTRDAGPEPPSPFGTGGERAFLSWLNDQLPTGGPVVTRYMVGIHAVRPDVQQTFPEPLGADAERFRSWFVTYGRQELGIPSALLPDDAPVELRTDNPAPYVTLAGFLRAELGVGEAARLLVRGLEAGGIPHNTIAYSGTANRQTLDWREEREYLAASDTNIVCVNADQFPVFANQMGPDFSAGRYTVAVWFWEVDRFPEAFHGAFNYVDEIWVASEYVRRCLLSVSPKPIHKFRLPVVAPPIAPSLTRKDVGIPEGFCFLFSFDFLSVLERKNPLAVIEAFQRAFDPGDGAVLVLKSINGDQRIREMEKLKYAARHRRDIILMDGYLPALTQNTLTAFCDCYVSLHRAEGFGLTIAEAMAMEKPVIATGYGGNLEFMNDQNSFLCGFTEREVGTECEPYPPDAHWADPNIDEAATLMRSVWKFPEDARATGKRAAATIREQHSPAIAGRLIRERLDLIRRRRARGETSPAIIVLEERIEALERANEELLQRMRDSNSHQTRTTPDR